MPWSCTVPKYFASVFIWISSYSAQESFCTGSTCSPPFHLACSLLPVRYNANPIPELMMTNRLCTQVCSIPILCQNAAHIEDQPDDTILTRLQKRCCAVMSRYDRTTDFGRLLERASMQTKEKSRTGGIKAKCEVWRLDEGVILPGADFSRGVCELVESRCEICDGKVFIHPADSFVHL